MQASIWVSSPPIAERNILRSRCNSAPSRSFDQCYCLPYRFKSLGPTGLKAVSQQNCLIFDLIGVKRPGTIAAAYIEQRSLHDKGACHYTLPFRAAACSAQPEKALI